MVFVVLDVGPSTKDTYEKHHRRYVEANEYRGGKTFRELVDEANTPRKKLRKRDKHLIAYNPNPALEFPEKLYDPSLKKQSKVDAKTSIYLTVAEESFIAVLLKLEKGRSIFGERLK